VRITSRFPSRSPARARSPSYAISSTERKLAEEILVADGLPRVVRWLAKVASSGNTVRGPNQTLTLSMREGKLASESTLDDG
jgi:hypothetical protein